MSTGSFVCQLHGLPCQVGRAWWPWAGLGEFLQFARARQPSAAALAAQLGMSQYTNDLQAQANEARLFKQKQLLFDKAENLENSKLPNQISRYWEFETRAPPTLRWWRRLWTNSG